MSITLTRRDNLQETGSKELSRIAPAITLAEYTKDYATAGCRRYPGSSGTWWLQHGSGMMVRLPIFTWHAPLENELRALHWKRFAPLASYLLEADEKTVPQTFVYLCTDNRYHLEDLDRRVRANVRRGLHEFEIRSLAQEELRQFGSQSYLDTWRRHGRENPTAEEFIKKVCVSARFRGSRFIGAWKSHELAAFVGIIEVDDWVEVRFRFSADAFLELRPNEALLYYILSHYLVERGFRTVSAGLSSIDPAANAPGLHRFKLKMGFTPVPVRRVFCFHPLLRPFICHASRLLVSKLGRRFPANHRLLLARYVLEHALQTRETEVVVEESSHPLHMEPDEKAR